MYVRNGGCTVQFGLLYVRNVFTSPLRKRCHLRVWRSLIRNVTLLTANKSARVKIKKIKNGFDWGFTKALFMDILTK